MPQLGATARAHLPDTAFAYIDSRGQRRLPIHDASHVRNALARFEQVAFEDDAARERARQRLLRAAKKYGIVPLGFFDGQLRKERQQTEIKARARDIASLPRGTVTSMPRRRRVTRPVLTVGLPVPSALPIEATWSAPAKRTDPHERARRRRPRGRRTG